MLLRFIILGGNEILPIWKKLENNGSPVAGSLEPYIFPSDI